MPIRLKYIDTKYGRVYNPVCKIVSIEKSKIEEGVEKVMIHCYLNLDACNNNKVPIKIDSFTDSRTNVVTYNSNPDTYLRGIPVSELGIGYYFGEVV